MDRFKRYYFHALRNGKTSEHAADQALAKVKDEILEILNLERDIDDYTKQEMWGNILADLIDWQAALQDIPIDLAKLKPRSEMKSIPPPGLPDS